MKIIVASRLWHVIVMVGIVAALVAGCTSSTPAPMPTPTIEPTAVPTPEPSATPIPPTATSTPTITPTPKPSAKNLMFGASADLRDGQAAPAKFAVGVPMIHAAIEVVGLPADARVEWRLTRDGHDVFTEKEPVKPATGTITRTLFEDARHILPGDYRLVVTVANQMVDGHFVVSGDQSAPGTTLFFDNFNDNTLDWDLSSDPRRASAISDGQLRLNVKAPDEGTVSLLPVELTDFDLSVAIKPEPGSATGFSSIWFRYTGAGGYVLDLFSDGTFAVSAGSFSSFKPLVELQRAPAFKRNDVNHVRILARGDKFAIYINDEQVATFSDKQYAKGELGLGAASLKQSGVVMLFDNLIVTTPREEVTMMPTPTKAPTKVLGTPGPKPTAPQPTTAGVSASVLLNAIVKARLAAEDVGGALDRLYGGGGSEGCGPLLADYATIAKAPTFDVSAQPANVQNAYGLYRQGIELLLVRLAPIAKVCLGGGGSIGKLDFDMARTAINEGASLLTQAQNAIGQ